MATRNVEKPWLKELAAWSPNEISARGFPHPVRAMQIVECPQTGTLIFAPPEVELEEHVAPRRLEVESGTWRRYRIELRTEDTAWKGHEVVLVWHPYSLVCWSHQPLRGPNRKGRAALASRAADPTRVTALVDSAGTEFFESKAGLTASFTEPPGFLDEASAGRQPKPDAYLIGLCADFQRFQTRLWDSDGVQRLWNLTENRTLRFSERADIRLHPSLIEECHSLLLFSVAQSLGGPHSPKRHDGTPWFSRGVVELVEDIYKGHVNNLNRRFFSRTRELRIDESHES